MSLLRDIALVVLINAVAAVVFVAVVHLLSELSTKTRGDQ